MNNELNDIEWEFPDGKITWHFPEGTIVWENPRDAVLADFGKQPQEIRGQLEAVGSFLRGLPGYVAGGLTGAGAALTGQGIDAAAAQQKYVQEKVDEFLGAKPKTEEGKRYLEAASQALRYPIEKAAEIGEEVAGSEGRLAAGVAAEALLNFMPLKAGKKALTDRPKPEIVLDQKEAPVDSKRVLDKLDQAVPPKITPEELAIDSQQVIGEQFGGRRPLGVEFPELRGQGGTLLELLPKEDYPIPDRGVRHLDPTTGKVVQGMAEDVPTIDFPLRQEVLQQPEIKAAIDAFRLEADRLRKLGDEAGIAKLESEFMAGMRQLGIYKPQDAIGMQKLWESVSRGDEPALRYPEGIRKGGEIDPRLTETEIPVWKDIPESVKASLPKMEPVKPKFRGNKYERGAINPESLREEFVASKDLGDGKTLIAYTEESGTTVHPFRDLIIRVFDEGRDVGGVRFGVDKPFGKEVEMALTAVENPFIKPEYRNQGLGKAMYEFAAELGNDIRAGHIQTPQGKGLWEGLNRAGVAQGKFIPAKQRGGIDPDLFGLSKAAEKIKGTFTTALAKLENQMEAFKSIPVSKEVKEALIPDDVPVEKVKEAAREAKDVSQHRMLIGGTHMLAEIKDHPIIYATVQWFNNADKRAQATIRDIVSPMEKNLNKILQNRMESELLHGIFMKEAKQGTRFTPEQLREAGTPEHVIKTYQEFREAFDAAYEAQNAARERLGQKPITFREAYISSRWGGNWRTPVYDKSGKLVWYIAEPTKYRAQAALDYLAQKYPELDIAKSKIEYREVISKETGPIEAGYHEMLQLLDPSDPRVDALKSIYEEYVTMQGEQYLGQTKHFEHKSGVRGYAGDRPWAKNDIREMFRQQIRYLRNSFTWAETQKAVSKAKEIFSDPELIEKSPNAIMLSKEVAKHRLGFGTEASISAIQHSIAKHLGLSPSVLAKMVGYPRMLFYWTKLAFMNLPYTAVSLIQPIFTLPWHVMLTRQGFGHNFSKTFASGLADAIGLFTEHTTNIRDPFVSEMGRKAAKYGIENGIIDINALSDVADLGRSKAVQSAEKAITFNMVYSERLSRAVAFMGFVKHLEQSGKFKGNDMALFQRAEQLTALSMADYRVTERAPIFNKLGLTGSALSTLNTFKINQFNQLYFFAKHAQKTGDFAPLLSLMAIQFAMGGAMGFFGINTLDSAWEFIKSNMPTKWWLKFKDVSIKEALVKAALQDPSKSWLVFGGASAATGINLYSRYDSGTIVEPSLEGLFPFIADLRNQIERVWKMVMDPRDPVKQAQALHAVAPSSVKGLVEATSPIFYDPKTGIASQVSDPLEGVYRRTPTEQTIRKFGFASLGEAKEKELKFRVAKQESQRRERLRETSEKLKSAVVFGTPEQVESLYKQYLELNGTVPDLERMFGEAFVRRMTTKLEQMQMKAKTPAGVKRYQEYVR